MDNHDLEQRLAALEEKFAKFKSRVHDNWEKNDIDVLKVELKVQTIERQLKEYDMVKAAAYGGYLATHPEVRNDITKLEEILGTDPPRSAKPTSAQ